MGGRGDVLSPLEWDVKMYLALNGALHDAAISAWEIKRQTDTARPISLLRYLASQTVTATTGLVPEAGVVEMKDGILQVKSWRPNNGVTWQIPGVWVPYQLDTFVTPAFPGFVSGHSTFSRAAAEVLSNLTGSAFFPSGLYEKVIPAGFIKIDSSRTNTSELRLQWAAYFDAADQSGQSRIWGGIHIEPDDLIGRQIGSKIGQDAVALAHKYFAGQAVK